jgi:hypothetical protein
MPPNLGNLPLPTLGDGKTVQQMTREVKRHRHLHGKKTGLVPCQDTPGQIPSGIAVSDKLGTREKIRKLTLRFGAIALQREENSQVIFQRQKGSGNQVLFLKVLESPENSPDILVRYNMRRLISVNDPDSGCVKHSRFYSLPF